MKQNLTAWGVPFVFTGKQRSYLLSALPGRSKENKEAAGYFIDAAQRTIEDWLSLDVKVLTTAPSEHKEKLERIEKATKELRAALDDIPNDTGAMLRAQVYTTLYCSPYKRNHVRLSRKLTQMGSIDPCADNFLEELLAVVSESAIRTADNFDVKTGVNNVNMISLTAKLARSYESHFQKKPSAANKSNFRQFMNELGTATYRSFGAATVKAAIKMVEKDRKHFTTPTKE